MWFCFTQGWTLTPLVWLTAMAGSLRDATGPVDVYSHIPTSTQVTCIAAQCIRVRVHMALVGYLIVFSIVTKCGQTIEFLLWGTIVPLNFLVGYHCSIVASTPQYPTTYGVRIQTHCTHGTYGVLHCLLFCDQTRPNLRISLVGYHCAIEFPCGVLLFYCCKYPTTYGVRVHMYMHNA